MEQRHTSALCVVSVLPGDFQTDVGKVPALYATAHPVSKHKGWRGTFIPGQPCQAPCQFTQVQ